MFITVNIYDQVANTTSRCAILKENIKNFYEIKLGRDALTAKSSVGISFKDEMTPSIFVTDTYEEVLALLNGSHAFTSGSLDYIDNIMEAGWNACRRAVYAVCEDMDKKAETEQKQYNATDLASGTYAAYHFHRGEISAVKSIARCFNSIEGKREDHFHQSRMEVLRAIGTGELK